MSLRIKKVSSSLEQQRLLRKIRQRRTVRFAKTRTGENPLICHDKSIALIRESQMTIEKSNQLIAYSQFMINKQ